jgi:hypothetical protein
MLLRRKYKYYFKGQIVHKNWIPKMRIEALKYVHWSC